MKDETSLYATPPTRRVIEVDAYAAPTDELNLALSSGIFWLLLCMDCAPYSLQSTSRSELCRRPCLP